MKNWGINRHKYISSEYHRVVWFRFMTVKNKLRKQPDNKFLQDKFMKYRAELNNLEKTLDI